MSAIKVILYDTLGTMVDWWGSLVKQGTAYSEAHGAPCDWPDLAAEWRLELKSAMKKVNHEHQWKNLDQFQRSVLDKLLPKFGMETTVEIDRERMTGWWRSLDPWPDVVPGLTRLRQRHPVMAFTNANGSLAEAVVAHAHLPADRILGADLFGHYKPDPALYMGAVNLLQIAPENILLVAAHNDDLNGARKAGMKTAFIPRPTEWGPGQTKDLKPEQEWDYTAPDVGQLADILALV